MSNAGEAVLVTGFPHNILTRFIVRDLLRDEQRRSVVCIVPRARMADAQAQLATFTPAQRSRFELLEGNPAAMDLGLSGVEYRYLARSVGVIHHAAVFQTEFGERADAALANVRAANEVAELASNAVKLERLVFWSRLVQGEAVLEEAPPTPGGDASSFGIREAETRIWRLSDHIPVTLLRYAPLHGSSASGEFSATERLYGFMVRLMRKRNDVPLVVFAAAQTPIHIVPVDWVAAIGLQLSRQPQSVGRVCHLLSREPVTIDEFVNGTARALDIQVRPVFIPLAFSVERLAPVTKGLTDWLPAEIALQTRLQQPFSDRNTREILGNLLIPSPKFSAYIGQVASWVLQHQRQLHEGATFGARASSSAA